MIYINNATSPYSEQRVTLGGINYVLTFKFNSRNQGWYLSIHTANKESEILTGIKLEPNQLLTTRYGLTSFSGELICMRVKNDLTPLGRGNFGRDKAYRLIWFSEDELSNLGAGDVIQLS